MKIVRVIARLNVGGPAKHVVWLTAGLQDEDCESLLIAGSVPTGEEDMSYFATQLGVSPLIVSEMSREVSPKDLITIWKLFRIFLRQRPDIIHTHTAKAGTVGRIAGLLYRWLTPRTLIGQPRQCRFVHTYHGHIFHSYYGSFKTGVFLAIERALARLITDRIVVVSEQQRREIQATFRVGRSHQFRVIPLGLDTGVFGNWQTLGSAFREEIAVRPDQILVGIVGRLTEIKNHQLFLRAIASLLSSRESLRERARFVIIGDGALRRSLEDLSHSLGLSENLLFVGNRTDPEIFYPALDVVALTSRNEGTPLSLIEAMANARPVVATSVGGVVDLLGEPVTSPGSDDYTICERGISVSSDQPENFAEALACLLEDSDLRSEISARGLRFAQAKFGKQRLLADVRLLYQDLLKPEIAAQQASGSAGRSVESGV